MKCYVRMLPWEEKVPVIQNESIVSYTRYSMKNGKKAGKPHR